MLQPQGEHLHLSFPGVRGRGEGPFRSPILLLAGWGWGGELLVLALTPLFFLELGNSILTWVTCSKEGFGYCRLCVIM